jgi:hypothetical protein
VTLRAKLPRGSFYAFVRAKAGGRTGTVEKARLVPGRHGRARVVREVQPADKN